MSAYDMMNEKKKPVYPTLDEGTYAEDVERGIAEAEKKAAEIERQAKRDRDMALIGDMAHLVSQGAAMHGGAWKIGQAQNEGAKGNERLRQLREKNAAQTAAFAKERAALMEAKRKEQNAQKLAKYNAEVEQYKRDLEAQKRAEDVAHREAQLEETRSYHDAQLGIQAAREKRLREQGGMPKMSRTEKGDIVMPLSNGEVVTFPRQYFLDNKKSILGAVRDEWEMALDDTQKLMLKYGKLQYPTEAVLESMMFSSPAAAQMMLELKAKAPQTAVNAGKGMIYDYKKKSKGSIY
jgi:hypothetical protein